MSSPMNADAQELDRLIGYLRADPSNLRLRADIFERALAGGRHDEAQRQVDWVLSRTPVDFGWRHRMAVLDMARGQPAAAAALLQSLVDEGQSDPAVAFNLAYIGDDFQELYPGPFDPGYMGKLYRYGQDRGRRGTGWQTTPPGYSTALPGSGA